MAQRKTVITAVHRLTKEQKEDLISSLDSMYENVYLKVDGYLVSATRVQVSGSKMEIFVFVDGVFNFQWIIKETEMAKRFFRRTECYILPKKQRDAFQKSLGKRAFKAYELDKRLIQYKSTWISSRSFINHIEKQNHSIEVIMHDQYNAMLEQKGGPDGAA